MKQSIIKITAAFLVLLLFVGTITGYKLSQYSDEETVGNNLLSLNEIEQLTKGENGISPAHEQIANLSQSLSSSSSSSRDILLPFMIMIAMCFAFMITIIAYLYFKILAPFDKLESFASELAKGNFDADLKYERTNFFGAFTWAFDHMRREITLARSREREAIESNKTVIATLSHDIKTPVASIRAYTEGLAANMDSSVERKSRYLKVIMDKCDEVTGLTNDLVMHSLSDLDKLQIQKQEVEIKDLIETMISDLEYGDIITKGDIPAITLNIDKKRMEQVLENILGNGRKYAPGKMRFWCEIVGNHYVIYIKDNGHGIAPEDMPFIFDKFYRGKNVNEQSGSGLGLYIAEYIMNKMGGSISLHNQKDGLEARLELPINE